MRAMARKRHAARKRKKTERTAEEIKRAAEEMMAEAGIRAGLKLFMGVLGVMVLRYV